MPGKAAACLALFCTIVLAMSCQRPRRDINTVLHNHDAELMLAPGVVGVYVGVLEDGKTPCLKIMVARRTPQLERRLPKALEGYPVVIEETGVIRPLQSQ